MKKSLDPGIFLIKKENLRLKEENSKLKARVENIENKLREAKLLDLLFPVVVASMFTVWGYDFLFFFDDILVSKEEGELFSEQLTFTTMFLNIRGLEFSIMISTAILLSFISFYIYRTRRN